MSGATAIGVMGIVAIILITSLQAQGGFITPVRNFEVQIENISSATKIAGNADRAEGPEPIVRTLEDDEVGNAAGWDPDGAQARFSIFDPVLSSRSVVRPSLDAGPAQGQCGASEIDTFAGVPFFELDCSPSPPGGAALKYSVTDKPE